MVLSFLLIFSTSAPAFDCLDLAPVLAGEATKTETPDGDFVTRDRWPQTDVPEASWHEAKYGRFGPCPVTYPRVNDGKNMPLAWRQERALAVARKYLGVPYKHLHFPALGGLDCSNFTAWVFNYAFGTRFSSNVETQAQSAGRRLAAGEALRPGDLLFLYGSDRKEIVHVAIYVDVDHVIDATGSEIAVRDRKGRYLDDFAWARRVLE
ncbi:hypothetical protein FACS1894113_5080 [Alphaproteobacteria bacterium]|nr:hypothetical protein FACS1894113_5080 [Alphaproteobacteria bacterium]